jgi:hypothetical protein
LIPVLGGTDFERDSWDVVVDPGRFDTAGLTRVDLDHVWLRQLSEALDTRKSVICVGPQRSVGTG